MYVILEEKALEKRTLVLIPLAPGIHTLTLRLEGHEDLEKTVVPLRTWPIVDLDLKLR